MHLGKLLFQCINLLLHGRNVDFGLLLEGVYIARDVEVVVVLGKLLAPRHVGVALLDDARLEFALRKAAVGRDDVVDILVAQPVLVLAVLKFAAGVDEEHVGRRLGLVEDGDGGRNARSVEEVGRESDDGFDEVLLDGLLADFSLAGAAEQHPVGNDDAHLAVLVGHLEHVADEGPVALALGRNAAPEAVVGVVGRLVGAPLFEREGGDWQRRCRTSSARRPP